MYRLSTAAVLLMAACCLAQSPEQKVFTERYGARAKAVSATPDKRDDAEFARQLIDDALKTDADPALRAYLLRKAYDLTAWHAEGLPIARQAATLLGQTKPDQKDAAEHLLLDVLKREFDLLAGGRNTPLSAEAKAAGLAYVKRAMEIGAARSRWPGRLDEAAGCYRSAATVAERIGAEGEAAVIAERLRDVSERQSVLKRAEQLRAALRKTSDQAETAAELVGLLLRAGQTDEACRYIPVLKDETLARVAVLAARHRATLGAPEAKTLGDWYRTAAEQSAGHTLKRAALEQARACYRRGVSIATGPQERAAFEEMLAQVDAALAKLPADETTDAALPGADLMDLAALVDPAADALEGEWRRNAGGLASSAAHLCRLRLPRRLPAEFDLYVDFTREQGDGMVVLIISRAQNPFQLCLGAGEFCALETMRGKTATDPANPLRASFPLARGRRYSVMLQVRSSSVTAFVDDRMLVRSDKPYELSGGQRWPVGRDVAGLGTDGAGVVFHRVGIVEHVPGGGPRPPDRVVDMLACVDVSRDTLNGAWRLAEGRLVPLVGMYQCLRIPYYPPDEYDLRVSFTLTRQGSAATVIVPRGDRAAAFTVDASGRCAFEAAKRPAVPGTRPAAEGEPPAIAVGSAHECLLKVRRNSITALVDGRRVAAVAADRESLGVPPHWSVGDRVPGLGSDGPPCVFHKVEMVEIGGDGRPVSSR